MSTIGILTMHRPLNFGCTLQAFATQEVLERLGHQVKMIDYLYPNASRDHRINLRHALLHAGNRLLAFFLTGQAFSRREQQYRDFLQQRLHLTQEYATKEDLAKDPPDFDSYCMGSDQIWNPNFINEDTSFLGSFVPDGKHLFSYASSFGITELAPKDVPEYKRLLQRFATLAVREVQGQTILQNQLGLQAQRTLDPTLLLTSDDWDKLAAPYPISRKYILCYGAEPAGISLVRKATELVSQMSTNSNERPLIVHIHGRPWQRFSSQAKYLFDVGPAQFLSLIKHASCVLTTSYHGTCFSLNYRVPFWSFTPPNGTDTRISDLLHLLGLQDRRKYFGEHLQSIGELRESYPAILQKERETSQQYLQKALASHSMNPSK
ncbi:MAG: polysaccharide pyruvyl transferase family protein [Victivallales bacterium]|nr:polysaccharide pyruvyl transferase family protein [Victivallales bacterium]